MIEESNNFSENFIKSVKASVINDITSDFSHINLNNTSLSQSKLHILNAPELILMKCTQPSIDGVRFRYVPFQFTIQDLLQNESESEFRETEYEISNIVNYTFEEK